MTGRDPLMPGEDVNQPRVSTALEEHLIWVGLALLSGFIGNLGYDLIKSPLQELIRRKRTWSREELHQQVISGNLDAETLNRLLELLAGTAIVNERRRRGLSVPVLQDLKYGPWTSSAGSTNAPIVIQMTTIKLGGIGPSPSNHESGGPSSFGLPSGSHLGVSAGAPAPKGPIFVGAIASCRVGQHFDAHVSVRFGRRKWFDEECGIEITMIDVTAED
ncbi:hypothetical protein [Actinoplanes sp. NPDC026619]|uniref:hypothetical protein n=1 Tax=Actinoplanes sp. NPDC026619 TaxID=3155798 RepID=UPI0033ECE050